MLQNISWQQYEVAIAIALSCYYTALAVIFYQAPLRNWWRKQQKGFNSSINK